MKDHTRFQAGLPCLAQLSGHTHTQLFVAVKTGAGAALQASPGTCGWREEGGSCFLSCPC